MKKETKGTIAFVCGIISLVCGVVVLVLSLLLGEGSQGFFDVTGNLAMIAMGIYFIYIGRKMKKKED